MKKFKPQLHAAGFVHPGKQLIKPFLCILFFMIVSALPSLAVAENQVTEKSVDTVEQEAGFYYTVKKGDTLWDLSQRFSDTPWVWPDLWQENKQIPNPHWIYPGNRIRLYHKGWVRSLDKLVETPAVEEPVYFVYKSIDMVGFIRKEAVPPSAVIFKSKYDKGLISEGDIVYLRKENESNFTPGSRFTVYRTLPKIKDNDNGDDIGVQHYLTGIVEIIKDEGKFVLANVTLSYRAIEIGDKLMPYIQKPYEIPVIKSKEGISGKVIVSEEHQGIFGDKDIAFFDKGEKDGIRTGQMYSLFQQEEATLDPKTKEKIILTPHDFGEVFVLHTEETTSTVIITKTQDYATMESKIRSPLN
jgi:hypothetical protein